MHNGLTITHLWNRLISSTTLTYNYTIGLCNILHEVIIIVIEMISNVARAVSERVSCFTTHNLMFVFLYEDEKLVQNMTKLNNILIIQILNRNSILLNYISEHENLK